MGRYILTKKELIDALKDLGDSDFIMVNLGGHTKPNYPITHIEDSTSVGFWELRCDSSISFWEALKQEKFDMKSYTDIEQSKKLAEILSLESADMYYHYNVGINSYYEDTPRVIQVNNHFAFFHRDIPCWSLTALFGVLQIYTTPTAFSTNISVPSLTKTKNGYSITYVGDYRIMESNNNDIESPIEIIADKPVDACVAMIEKLHELKML